MGDGLTVYKLVETVGTSTTGFSDAVRGAVERAAETLQDVRWFEVHEMRGRVDKGHIEEFQVKVKVAFRLHAAEDEARHGDREIYGEPRTRPTRAARSTLAQRAALKGEHRRPGLSHPDEATPEEAAATPAEESATRKRRAPAKKEPVAARRGKTPKKTKKRAGGK